MPVYDPTSAKKPQASSGRGAYVWGSATAPEAVTVGTESVQISMPRDKHLPSCLSAEIKFSADPGAFQIDLQTADTDTDDHYVTKASMTSGLNSAFVGRIEAINVVATFVRLKMVALANAVTVTAKLS